MLKLLFFQEKLGTHSDQQPYISVWQDLVQNPPSCVKPWVKPGSQALALHGKSASKMKPKAPPKPKPSVPSAPPKIYPEITEPPEWPAPPLLPPFPPQQSLISALQEEEVGSRGPATGTQSHRVRSPMEPDSTVVVPLRTYGIPVDPLTFNPSSTGLSLLLTFITGRIITPLSLRIPLALLG